MNDMRILLLERLRPGDLILETGVPQIAAAAGGPYGHAAVALGRLVKIEAGKETGVVLNSFDFVAFRRGNRRIVGTLIEPGESVCVLRRKEPLDEGVMRGEALWEAGRAYSVPKLLELSDLPKQQRKYLERKLERMPAPDPTDVREGRFCSEVAAKVLGLNDTIVNPNALVSAPELELVTDAVVDLDPSWTEVASETSAEAIGTMLDSARVGLAELGLSELLAAAERIRSASSDLTLTQEAEEICARLEGLIRKPLMILNAVKELEASVLASRSVQI